MLSLAFVRMDDVETFWKASLERATVVSLSERVATVAQSSERLHDFQRQRTRLGCCVQTRARSGCIRGRAAPLLSQTRDAKAILILPRRLIALSIGCANTEPASPRRS